MKNNIIIGVSSGIAAYKVLDLIADLKKESIEIQVIMTTAAAQMIDPKKFEKASGNTVHTQLFKKNFDYQEVLEKQKVKHVELADTAKIFVIAPATANTIAKLANGIADDLLTTTALATTAPILVCPSMNVHMWHNPMTQENLSKLKRLGMNILHPDNGRLACGYDGIGRLADSQKIKAETLELLKKGNRLKGKKILITAGATRESIDAVRFITNPSSGKMGAALAEICFLQGANVTLLRAKNSVEPRYYAIKQELFETPDNLYALIKKHAPDTDAIFHAAAVSDFGPEKKLSGKIDSNHAISLRLVPQRKIINEIKKTNPDIFVVAFKAVHKKTKKEMADIGRQKLSATIDAVVVNDIGRQDRGFAADTNEVILVQEGKKPITIPLASKREIAKKILDAMRIY